MLHGLNKVMFFQRFTTYFNQPISTTTSRNTANSFTKGVGIILELMSGAMAGATAKQIPKFLSVSWLSCFPNEDEKLYYGSNVLFTIRDIIEASTMKGHRKELGVLNKFQRTVMNREGEVKWDMNNKKDRKNIEDVAALVKQQTEDKEEEEKEPASAAASFHFVTDFGAKLFREFCEHRDKIFIRAFKSLPMPMRRALFGGNVEQISLVPLATLFKNAQEIELSELSLNHMASEAQMYVDAVMALSRFSKDSPVARVTRISFKSERQDKDKENAPLKHLAQRRAALCRAQDWNVKYQFASEKCHELVFTHVSKANK